MAENQPGATAPEKEITTPTVENTNQETESTTQEITANDIAQRIAEYEKRIKEFADKTAKLESTNKEAIAQNLQLQAQYKGLQNSTTAKLQEYSQLTKRIEESERNRGELLEIKEYLQAMVGRVLDEQERKDIEFKQRENRLKLAEQAAQEAALRAQQPVAYDQTQAASTQQYQDPTDEKKRFLDFYFPGVELDPNDPNIDWGNGATSQQEAFRRVNVSVLKIKEGRDQARAQDIVDQLKKQTEESLAQLRAEAQELASSKESDIEAVRKEESDKARKAAEKRLRELGADAGTTPPTESQRRVRARVDEELDEGLLTQGEPGSMKRKQGEQEFARRMKALKSQLTGQ